MCILHTRKARQRLTNLHRLKTKSIGLEELNNSLSTWFRLDERMRESFSSSKFWQAGIAQWLERQTRDWKVTGLNPCWSGGIIFFSRVGFLCWLLFWYLFHPHVTAVARKRSWSFCQKCRWQVTAKRIHLTYVALHEATWCMVVWCTQNLLQNSCSFMWHQPCQCCTYTALMDI